MVAEAGLALQRLRKCSFNAPPTRQSAGDSCLAKSGPAPPLAQRQRFDAEGDHTIIAAIVGIRQPRLPTAILLAVGTIIVLAAKIGTRWPLAQVTRECREIIPA